MTSKEEQNKITKNDFLSASRIGKNVGINVLCPWGIRDKINIHE